MLEVFEVLLERRDLNFSPSLFESSVAGTEPVDLELWCGSAVPGGGQALM